MNNYVILLAALVLGGSVAFFDIQGLWWTVVRLPRTSQPEAMVFISLLVRQLTVLTVGFILAWLLGWVPLAAFLIGLISMRFVLIRWKLMRFEQASEASDSSVYEIGNR